MFDRIQVDFSKHVRDWDGFGVNYVEAAQTRDYKTSPQEYGGFSLLTESHRQEILDMIFGEDGLKPGVLKMFLDSFGRLCCPPKYVIIQSGCQIGNDVLWPLAGSPDTGNRFLTAFGMTALVDVCVPSLFD